ncbi:MAG: pilin [bacterium]
MKFKVLFIFTVFLFGLFFLFPSSAKAVSHTTGCGEGFSIGSSWSVCCERECCSWDELGGCTSHCCVDRCTNFSCSGSWEEFNASTNGKEPDIQIKKCQSVCGPASSCCSCGSCRAQCTNPEICKECGSWQEAVRSCTVTHWGLNMPQCKCNASYIDEPVNPRYYNNSNYPTDFCNPEESENPDNVLLPVKLDWDDARGWIGGWKEGNTCHEGCSDTCPQNCYAPAECYEKSECVRSYVLKIEGELLDENGATTSSHTAVLDKSEFLPPNSCFFKSNQTYTWHVKACCDTKGESCGPESTWSFTTNPAPEPFNPYDLDWEGLGMANILNQEEIESLKWCEIEDPNIYEERVFDEEIYYKPLSYKVLIYYSENDLCHEQLEASGQCLPIILDPEIIPVPRESLPPEEFLDDGSFFTKQTTYAWKVAACKDDDGQECSDYSQLWRFNTGDWDLETILVNPPNNTTIPVGLPLSLRWSSPGANSFNYKIENLPSGKTKEANIALDSPQLSLNTVYEWSVQPCSDYNSEQCEDSWGGPWSFRTTGGSPQLTSLPQTGVPIPVNFNWKAVPGAKSYVLNAQGEGLNKDIITTNTSASLAYPELKQETDYSWKVKTCAREQGRVCGNYSTPQSFTTFRLNPPEHFSPEKNGSFFTNQKTQFITWERVEGANFYQYEVLFTEPSSEETSQACAAKTIIPETITEQANSDLLNLICLGKYQWRIRPCMDINCQDTGNWSELINFSFVKGEASSQAIGLVPCGRNEDNPETSWNERETCQFKHIFLLIRNIVDFILWTFGPLALGVLVLGTGLMFYFSIKFQDSLFLTRIKLIWKAAGIGYGILFLSWTILNLFLRIVGFQIGIFGQWWQF